MIPVGDVFTRMTRMTKNGRIQQRLTPTAHETDNKGKHHPLSSVGDTFSAVIAGTCIRQGQYLQLPRYQRHPRKNVALMMPGTAA